MSSTGMRVTHSPLHVRHLMMADKGTPSQDHKTTPARPSLSLDSHAILRNVIQQHPSPVHSRRSVHDLLSPSPSSPSPFSLRSHRSVSVDVHSLDDPDPGLPQLPYDISPAERVGVCGQYLIHPRHEVRMQALDELRRYASQIGAQDTAEKMYTN
eukprot:TRINITY_DN13531_c0_g1_i2.p1 TRINITY_DN13531_c0_g1~~TRINITY_DN13531_c0_g1_i2.p1  ORF type:complete len:155 (-),score=29.87 TRINITY_DN13531_c0_g1_i2:129-593(-)